MARPKVVRGSRGLLVGGLHGGREVFAGGDEFNLFEIRFAPAPLADDLGDFDSFGPIPSVVKTRQKRDLNRPFEKPIAHGLTNRCTSIGKHGVMPAKYKFKR